MLFRRCTVNGVDYNHPPSEYEQQCSTPNSPAPPVIANTKMLADLFEIDQMQNLTTHSQRIQEFFLVLTICNTVVVSAAPHRDMMNASGMIESQDEPSPHGSGVKIVKPSEASSVAANCQPGNSSSIGGM